MTLFAPFFLSVFEKVRATEANQSEIFFSVPLAIAAVSM